MKKITKLKNYREYLDNQYDYMKSLLNKSRMLMEQEEIDRLYDYRPMTEKGSQEEFSKGWVPDNKPREFDE